MDLSMSILGWFHTVPSAVALLLGPWMVLAPKGTRLHRKLGGVFTLSILLASVTSLFIYRDGAFGRPHAFAVMAIVAASAGFALAHWKRPAWAWRYLHITAMLLAVYVVLGGFLNEVFLRVGAAKAAVAVQPWLLFQLHGLLMLGFLLLIPGFILVTALSRWLKPRAGARAT